MTATKPPGGQPRIRLGELLVKAGVITDAQLKTALLEQKQWGGKLGDILVRMRYLSEDVFVRALSKQLGLPRADLTGNISLEALARIPAELAEEYELVPVTLLDEGKTIAVATADPLNVTVLDSVRSVTRLRVVAQVAGASQIRAAIARLYQSEDMRPAEADGPLQIISNAEDSVQQQARQNNTSPTLSRPMQIPAPVAPAQPPFAPQPVAQPVSNGYLPATPAYPFPSPFAGIPTPAHGIPVQSPPQTAPGVDRAALEESQRREVQALKALVELLVQKGVISLDEYLAKLRQKS